MLTAEQIEIQALAREFAGGEIRPGVLAWDAARAHPEGLREKLAELGFLGMRIPESDGGLGLDLVTFLLALEELAWGDASVAVTVARQNGPVAGLLLTAGAGEQREWLPLLASGEVLGAWGVPHPGSDLDARPVAVERRGEEWVLSGRIPRVVDGGRAGVLVVEASAHGEEGATDLFLVPGDAPGLTAGERVSTLGLRALPVVPVDLAEVRVPESSRVGPPGGGRALVERLAPEALLAMAAVGIGIARAAAEHAVRYALERVQFDRPIAEFEAIREKLGGMVVRVSAARAALHQAARRVEGVDVDPASVLEGGEAASAAAAACLAAGDAAEWVASEAVQIHGGYGYMRDYPVEKLMRDAQAVRVLEGTPDHLRLRAAAAFLEEAATRG